jgi:3-deoxy-D-manno-octulosonic-acid transferase
MLTAYNLFIFFYGMGIRIAALFGNQKAKQWIDGRKDIFQKLSEFSRLPDGQGISDSRLIWFHCSSLGEFEQGRPVMEKLRMQNAECRIILTFFSPSGHEVRKNYAGADLVCYLPMDSKKNARRFIKLVNPGEAYFVKYEYWHYYFHTLKEKKIPLYMVSAIFRDNHVFFKWYGNFFRKILKCVTHFFVQDENSLRKLNSIGLRNATVTGDTRFDRVAEIAASSKSISLLEKFCAGQNVIVAGSTWLEDERLIYDLRFTIYDLKLVIAPHDISENRIKEVENLFSGTHKVIRHSDVSEVDVADKDVLIIDSIGMLSSLYRYAWVAYVGGGFGAGIHNILEAAVYGKPVFFGPRYHKAAEAVSLIKHGGAFSITGAKQLIPTLEKFKNDESSYSASCEASRKFVSENTGATEKILQKISEYDSDRLGKFLTSQTSPT